MTAPRALAFAANSLLFGADESEDLDRAWEAAHGADRDARDRDARDFADEQDASLERSTR